MDGVETAVAAARVDVRPATWSVFHRGPAHDFPSTLGPSSPPVHTGAPGTLPSPLSLSARPEAFRVIEGCSLVASRSLASYPFNHGRTAPSAPLSADACAPDGLRPIPLHKRKEKS